ncbi:hypothetical protein B0H13DRAFT_1864639 [Mycena leptocephala]|nr:hypothetical protein B0H13DRAFT_1864639 [Mycena leptocephala]
MPPGVQVRNKLATRSEKRFVSGIAGSRNTPGVGGLKRNNSTVKSPSKASTPCPTPRRVVGRPLYGRGHRDDENPHGFCYNNMNLSTSRYVEQRGVMGPAKVTSGTFGVLYGLRNTKWQHMLIAPIMEAVQSSNRP